MTYQVLKSHCLVSNVIWTFCLLLLYLSAFVSEFRLKTRLTVAIQQLVCLANVEIRPELYPQSLHLLKTWSISIFQLTYILCFLGLVLLLLSACWRDSSWVSRFSSCCALQKNLTERWEVIQQELDSLLQVAHNLSTYFAWPFADLTRYFSNYIPPIFFFMGGGGGGEMLYGAKKMNLSITLKFNLLFPSPYERWTLWVDLVSRISFRETLETRLALS